MHVEVLTEWKELWTTVVTATVYEKTVPLSVPLLGTCQDVKTCYLQLIYSIEEWLF